MNSEWVAYGADFVSFLIHKLPTQDLDRVRDIILFGSVVRDDWTEESDLDLLVDTPRPAKLRTRIAKLHAEFLQSVKVTRYWSLLGTRPEISLHVESIDEWPAAHLPLLKDGHVLYGRYRGIQASPGRLVALISWEDVSPPARRVNLYRKLSGYKTASKRYPGLLEKEGGEKLSKGAVLVLLSTLEAFKQVFLELEVPVRIRILAEVDATQRHDS